MNETNKWRPTLSTIFEGCDCDDCNDGNFIDHNNETKHDNDNQTPHVIIHPRPHGRRLNHINNLHLNSHRKINQMIIFDWDDTLFPTTAFKHGSPFTPNQLYNCGRRLLQTLVKYIRYYDSSNIYIITNGMKFWIKESLFILSSLSSKYHHIHSGLAKNDYFQLISDLLFNNNEINIKIISAQCEQGINYPGEFTRWKEETFKKYAKEHFLLKHRDIRKYNLNILTVIGDSLQEHRAAFYAFQYLENKRRSANWFRGKYILQRIRLDRFPSFDQYMDQLGGLIYRCNEISYQEESFNAKSHDLNAEVSDLDFYEEHY